MWCQLAVNYDDMMSDGSRPSRDHSFLILIFKAQLPSYWKLTKISTTILLDDFFRQVYVQICHKICSTLDSCLECFIPIRFTSYTFFLSLHSTTQLNLLLHFWFTWKTCEFLKFRRITHLTVPSLVSYQLHVLNNEHWTWCRLLQRL